MSGDSAFEQNANWRTKAREALVRTQTRRGLIFNFQIFFFFLEPLFLAAIHLRVRRATPAALYEP